MDDAESLFSRFSRTLWTAWTHVTGTVERYFRPEPTNEGQGSQSAAWENAMTNEMVSQGSRESSRDEEVVGSEGMERSPNESSTDRVSPPMVPRERNEVVGEAGAHRYAASYAVWHAGSGATERTSEDGNDAGQEQRDNTGAPSTQKSHPKQDSSDEESKTRSLLVAEQGVEECENNIGYSIAEVNKNGQELEGRGAADNEKEEIDKLANRTYPETKEEGEKQTEEWFGEPKNVYEGIKENFIAQERAKDGVEDAGKMMKQCSALSKTEDNKSGSHEKEEELDVHVVNRHSYEDREGLKEDINEDIMDTVDEDVKKEGRDDEGQVKDERDNKEWESELEIMGCDSAKVIDVTETELSHSKCRVSMEHSTCERDTHKISQIKEDMTSTETMAMEITEGQNTKEGGKLGEGMLNVMDKKNQELDKGIFICELEVDHELPKNRLSESTLSESDEIHPDVFRVIMQTQTGLLSDAKSEHRDNVIESEHLLIESMETKTEWPNDSPEEMRDISGENLVEEIRLSTEVPHIKPVENPPVCADAELQNMITQSGETNEKVASTDFQGLLVEIGTTDGSDGTATVSGFTPDINPQNVVKTDTHPGETLEAEVISSEYTDDWMPGQQQKASEWIISRESDREKSVENESKIFRGMMATFPGEQDVTKTCEMESECVTKVESQAVGPVTEMESGLLAERASSVSETGAILKNDDLCLFGTEREFSNTQQSVVTETLNMPNEFETESVQRESDLPEETQQTALESVRVSWGEELLLPVETEESTEWLEKDVQHTLPEETVFPEITVGKESVMHEAPSMTETEVLEEPEGIHEENSCSPDEKDVQTSQKTEGKVSGLIESVDVRRMSGIESIITDFEMQKSNSQSTVDENISINASKYSDMQGFSVASEMQAETPRGEIEMDERTKLSEEKTERDFVEEEKTVEHHAEVCQESVLLGGSNEANADLPLELKKMDTALLEQTEIQNELWGESLIQEPGILQNECNREEVIETASKIPAETSQSSIANMLIDITDGRPQSVRGVLQAGGEEQAGMGDRLKGGMVSGKGPEHTEMGNIRAEETHGPKHTNKDGKSTNKRGFENVELSEETEDQERTVVDHLQLMASTLDSTAQKARLAVKNPLIRPPKNPRSLLTMASAPASPASPPCRPERTGQGGAKIPGAIGIKLPGLDAGFPSLRKTQASVRVRGEENTETVGSQSLETEEKNPADYSVKQDSTSSKPKWTPPRHPGMGSPLMMSELRSKLKKTSED